MTIPNRDVVGIGRAYTDYVAIASKEVLERNEGLIDAVRKNGISEIIRVQSEITALNKSPGGCVANTLAGIRALGGRVALFAKVASDATGTDYLSDLRSRGIDVLGSPVDHSGIPSAVSLVWGDRFGSYRGCSQNFAKNEFTIPCFQSAQYFLVEGFLLADSPAINATIHAIEIAKQASCKIVITLSHIKSWNLNPHIARDIVAQKADIIIGNEAELGAYKAALSLASSTDQLVVITKGDKGAEAIRGSENLSVPASNPTLLINTLGAGDQFLAGLLFGLSRGNNLQDSMTLGIRTATAILGEIAARPTNSWTHFVTQCF